MIYDEEKLNSVKKERKVLKCV